MGAAQRMTTKGLGLPALVVAMLGALVAPTGASAADYCVASPVGCSGINYTAMQLQMALDDAGGNPGADRVVIGAGTFVGPFAYASASPVEILGSGTAATTLTNGGGASAFALTVNTSQVVHDLTLRATGGATAPGGLELGAGSEAYNVAIVTDATAANPTGVSIGSGATLRSSTIQLSRFNGYGVLAETGSFTLRDTTLDNTVTGPGTSSEAIVMLNTPNSAVGTVDRVKVTGFKSGMTTRGGTLNATQSLVDLGSTPAAVGFSASSVDSGDQLTFGLDGVTVVGTGADQVGIDARANVSAQVTTVNVRNSLVHLTGALHWSFSCQQGSTGSISFAQPYSAFDKSRQQTAGSCAPTAANSVDVADVPLAFANVATRDYTPVLGSPLVDAGQPGPAASAVDLPGRSRVVNDRVDIGAFEYQRPAPTGVAITPSSTTPVTGAEVTFTGAASDGDGGTPTYSWNFGDGSAVATGASVKHAFPAAGTPTVTLTVTGANGATSTATVALTVREALSGVTLTASTLKPALGSNVTFTGAGTAGDGAALAFSWNFGDGTPVATGASAVHRFTKLGARTVTLTVTTAGGVTATRTATLTVQPLLSAFKLLAAKVTVPKVATPWALQTKAAGATARVVAAATTNVTITLERKVTKPRPAFVKVPGSAALKLQPGTRHLRFGGKWAGKKLAKGTYRVTLTPKATTGTAGAPIKFVLTLQ